MALGNLVDKPLMQNPLAGGGAPQIIDPSVITPRGGAPETDDPIMQGFYNSEFYKPNAPTTTDVVNYTYQGKPMQGSSSNISQFQQYLDSIGKGNLIQRNDQIFSQETGPLAVGDQQLESLDLSKINKNPYNTEFIGIGADQTNLFGYKVPDEVIAEQKERMKNNPIDVSAILRPGMPGYTPLAPILDGTKGFPVTVSGDDSIASTATVNPYQEQFTGFANQLTGFGDQLTGFGDQFSGLDKQFTTINTRLDNVDEGIASLSEQLQPQKQLYNSPYSNFNFRTNSYSNPSPFGLGSLFMRRY